MSNPSFEFDVAISFLAADEGLAVQLAEQLRDRYKVFVYSERQKELAGKDGLEQFSRIFGGESRVVAVLYRDGWGKTKWTRVEETVIKERALDTGWDFLLVVALDNSGAPVWLPKTKIWLGYERFGLQAAAGVIDARIHENGGLAVKETARQRAERFAGETRRNRERASWLTSDEGLRAAMKEIVSLFTQLEAEVKAIAELADAPPIEYKQHTRGHLCVVRTPRVSIIVKWAQRFSNSLNDSGLHIEEFDGVVFLESERGASQRPLTRRTETSFQFGRDEAGVSGWQEGGPGSRFYTSTQLVDHYLNRLLDRISAIQG